MATCRICGERSAASSLSVCADCLRSNPEAIELVRSKRVEWRESMGLPPRPPRGGRERCSLCVNECELNPGERGFCGTVVNEGGSLRPITGSWRDATGLFYLDPLPTNCVATPVCPAATCRGYPDYTDTCGPEYGRYNLAVFYGSCNLDCFFCQNAEHKAMAVKGRPVMEFDRLLATAVREDVPCIRVFGGDPGPWTPHALMLYREVRRRSEGIKRMCWETNGLENPKIFESMARSSLESGGIVKVDFKAWSREIYEALTGVDGRDRVLENLRIAARIARERIEPPLLVVSVLLVPNYVDPAEVGRIAEFVASLDANIPMVLLAFYPQHLAVDLGRTKRRHAEEALRAAREAGIEEVYLGNEWLLT